MKTTALRATLAGATVGLCQLASAVALNPDGLGQGLVYPYYTVQASNGDNMNTFVSIVNHASATKAIRVRFREGRGGKEVASFNLFLGPSDIWTGAVVPGTANEAAVLVTADKSCTGPAIAASGLVFQNALYTGAGGDTLGAGLDRTREGFIEAIEMATLTGATASAVRMTSGVPVNCAATQSIPSGDVAAPGGGLSGSVTLINVANGMDFAVNAEALAELSTQPFYRPPGDAYPDFNAAEIAPTSVVMANGAVYRSTWSRPVDAVSAVLMRSNAMGEYVLDAATRSNTDFALTFPTRQFYVAQGNYQPPFSGAADARNSCFYLTPSFTDREARIANTNLGSSVNPPGWPYTWYPCFSASVFNVANGAPHSAGFGDVTTYVLGSRTGGVSAGDLQILSTFEHGAIDIPLGEGILASQSSSTRMDPATGTTTNGAHRFTGLPVIGFMVRTFRNGTLSCAAGTCQGNYGAALPLQYTRSVTP